MAFKGKRKETPQVAQLTVADMLQDLNTISKLDTDIFGKLYTGPTNATSLESLTTQFDEKIIDHPSISPEKEFVNASQATINSAYLSEKKDQNVNLRDLYQKTYQ